ncbi:D-2-hydroxyacid dehydrogenase [Luteolibacter sp. LG18]|uniref:D-2-hydroxyacid dehydrogenase n=1 Tax=Luteolibacter sp. LG18 TaxID=2819286 RepID=UPI002B2CF291|nr:glycerate dehydrogenase [Luteolibacter sp. LG18]
MKVVFLDASTIDRADLDFTPLRAFGSLTLHQVTPPDKVGERIADADIVITNKALVTRDALANATKVRLVVSAATGVNQIDLEACKDRGVTVCNVAGYSTEGVAQHTFALLLNLVTAVDRYSASIAQDWPASPIFTRLDHPVTELAGKTLGIVGFGSIGQAVARIGTAFGMKVVAYARNESAPDAAVPRVAGDAFFSTCDVISLHCPLTPQTERFINRVSLALMKPDSLLINTGRGPLIDDHALADALRHGEIGGAALDVLSVEPPPKNHPLLATDIPNLLITPHTAWTSQEARQRLLAGVIADIRAFLDGRPIHHIV